MLNYKKLFVTQFAVSLAMVIAALAWPGNGQQRGSTLSLPEGSGRQIMLQACVQCHDFKVVVSQRKSEQAWRRTVDDMVWRGAPMLPGEAEILTRYLTDSFGPTAPLPQSPRKEDPTEARDKSEPALAQYLPAGEGRKLVLQACAQCHGLREIVTSRKTPADWNRSVRQMLKLGTALTASEAVVVMEYLSRSFSPEKPLPEALQRNPQVKGDSK